MRAEAVLRAEAETVLRAVEAGGSDESRSRKC
jgi:hypothetical protein